MKTIDLIIYGQCYSKSNSRIFSYKNGKPLLFKNHKVMEYVEEAKMQLIPQLKNHTTYTGNVCLEVKMYYKTKLSDLDVSLVQDILQRDVDKQYGIVLFKGLYLNDRQIFELHLYKYHDKENPRVEIKAYEI